VRLAVVFDRTAGAHRLVGSPADEDAARFLDALAVRGLSPRTARAYAYDLLRLFRWLDEQGRELSDLDGRLLLEYIRAQREEGAKPRSINRRLSTCRLFFKFVTGRDLPSGRGVSVPAPYYRGRGRDRALGLHPVSTSRRSKLRVKEPRALVEPLTVEEVRSFLQTLRRYRDLAIVYLMLLCGLRSREVRLLRVADLRFDDNRLRVQGKGGKERQIPLPCQLVQTLHDYLRLERPDNADGDDRLFVVLQGTRRGRAMTEEGLRQLFRYRRSTVDLPNANAHRFRHTFGADMARGGVRLPILQKMMGHAHAETTLAYVNLAMADVAAEYERAAKQIQRRYAQSETTDDERQDDS
jgi:site-specific recombinase XerD